MDAVDNRIALAEQHFGPVAAASESALELLNVLSSFDHACSRYDPDSKLMPITEFSKKRQREIAEQLASTCEEIRTSLTRLSDYLDRKEIWDALCEANEFPASIGEHHAPCYAEAAYRLGRDRYGNAWLLLNPELSVSGVESRALPPIETKAIMDCGIEGFIRGCKTLASEWDWPLAEQHVHKEFQRQAGMKGANRTVFKSADTTPTARFVFPQCPKCGASSGGNGTRGSVRYAKCKSKKCGHRFKLPKTSS